MTSFRRFRAVDLLSLQNVNLDPLTENYSLTYYLHYLVTWPEYFVIAKSSNNRTIGYIMGKSEGDGKKWHGHVSAVTIAPEYRRMGMARRCMEKLESITENVSKGYFVDLFVRVSNDLAIGMYKSFGYVVYRRIIGYYSDEDAYDMRKATKFDPKKESMVPLLHPVSVADLDTD